MRLIDADELKTAFPCGEYVRTESVRATIDNMPTIEPERKKGKWFWTDGMYACDQCHEVLDEKSPFCPMCGADMREPEDIPMEYFESGGSLNYFYTQLQDHVGDFGDKELDALVEDLAELFHDREWYLSSDTGSGDWREAREAFKEKWFTEHGRQERIEQYLQEFCNEVRETFGMMQSRCKTCKHWTEQETGAYYGKCEYHTTCLMHRSEYCEKYEVEHEQDA